MARSQEEAPSGDRIHDRTLTKRMLYQLSYRGCAMQLLLRSLGLRITLECQPGCGFSLSSLLVFLICIYTAYIYIYEYFLFGFPLFPSRLSRLYTGAKHDNVGALMSSRCHQGAHGVVVSHPLSMREAPGSIPGVSILVMDSTSTHAKIRHLWDSNPRGETPSA